MVSPPTGGFPTGLLLGIDGGGTGTVALLGRRDERSSPIVLGRGVAGPANPQVIGFAAACRVIDEAINAAFAAAGLARCKVASCCLALAGAGRDDDRKQLEAWATQRGLAEDFQQVHDAMPVLAEGTPSGWGVAIVSGTGSLAFGRDASGRTARAGGWGYLFGDEGSGYWIALAALRAVASAVDGRRPLTALTGKLQSALKVDAASQLVSAVYGQKLDRAALSALAPLVLATAEAGDRVAEQIVSAAAMELAAMVASVARQLDLAGAPFPLALSGGVLSASALLKQQLLAQLKGHGLIVEPIKIVGEPALGSLRLAAMHRSEIAG